MGNIEFLVGPNGSGPSNLPDLISDLEDASMIFFNRWSSGELSRAAEVSIKAMTLFDFISNELLRLEVARKGANMYDGTSFAAAMASFCGRGVSGVSQLDYSAVLAVGAGNGRLPTHLGPFVDLRFRQLLNKVKHRNPSHMNFRFENARHICVICADQSSGGAEGIYEFAVTDFCTRSRLAAAAL